jgi:hypothetical protein
VGGFIADGTYTEGGPELRIRIFEPNKKGLQCS